MEMRSINTPHTEISVSDFGVTTGDGRNQIEGIRQAVKRCHEVENAKLIFPEGRYDIWDHDGEAEFESFMRNNNQAQPTNYEPPPYGYAMQFMARDRLIIDGQGSEFMMHGFTQPFQFVNCSDLVLQNFTIDWKRPPFSVGTVVDQIENGIDVEVWDDFPVRGGEPIHIFQEYDPDTRRPTPDEYMGIKSTELVRPQVLRISMGRNPDIRRGQIIVMRHPICCFWGIELLTCRNVIVRDVNMYATPGIGVMGRACHDTRFERVHFVPRPNSNRIMSICHDAIMLSSCGGSAELIDSVIGGMGDDGYGTGAGSFFIARRIDNKSIEAYFRNHKDFHQKPHSVPPVAGQHIDFIKKEKGCYGSAQISEVDFNDVTGVMRITFAEKIPDAMEAEDALTIVERMADMHVKGCRFEPNRSRGVMIGRTRSALIEENTFDGTGGSAIFMHQWARSDTMSKTMIRNNVFRDCGYAVAHMGGNAVVIEDDWFELATRYHTMTKLHRNVEVEGNRFIGKIGPALALRGIDGLTVRNNVFENPMPAITLRQVENALIQKNVFTGADDKNGVALEDGCDKDTIQIANNK